MSLLSSLPKREDGSQDYSALPRQGSLRHHFAWAMAGQAVYAGCQWGMLVVLAKLGTPSMVGQFALGFAVSGPVFMFANMQLRAVIATDAARRFSFGEYMALQLVMSAAGLGVVGLIVALTGYSTASSAVIFSVAMAKCIETISEVCYGTLQQHEQVKCLGMAMMIKGPLALLALTIGVLATGTVLAGVIGMTLAWLTVLLFVDFRFAGRLLKRVGAGTDGITPLTPVWFVLRPIMTGGRWRDILWLTLPLGCVSMLISLNSNIPRYFIEHYWSEKELGVFSALAYLSLAGSIVVQALGSSASARLAQYYERRDRAAFSRLLGSLLGGTLLLGIVGVLITAVAAKPFLRLLYRPEYAERSDVMLLIVIGAGVASLTQILSFAAVAARALWVQLPLFFVGGLILTGFCAWLVPTRASIGAAWSMVLTSAVLAIGCGVIVALSVRRCRPIETECYED